LNQERALNLFVLSHFLRNTGIHQQNSGVPEFCHYQWRKSETSDLRTQVFPSSAIDQWRKSETSDLR
jgi:hypothetical protein